MPILLGLAGLAVVVSWLKMSQQDQNKVLGVPPRQP